MSLISLRKTRFQNHLTSRLSILRGELEKGRISEFLAKRQVHVFLQIYVTSEAHDAFYYIAADSYLSIHTWMNDQKVVGWTDTPTDILPKGKCKMRSKFWWLTGFCNSHDVSHFTAFFIVVGAKTSIEPSVNRYFSRLIFFGKKKRSLVKWVHKSLFGLRIVLVFLYPWRIEKIGLNVGIEST